MDKNATPQTVLLVDDEADIRDVLEIALRDMSFEVLAAENGSRALEIYREKMPPLVLTDIKMPGMDGIELLRRIKCENPETEVIMITGHGDMQLAIRSLKHKATDFVTKPIDVDGLEVVLKRACERILMREKLREYTQNLERLVREKSELQDHLASLGLMVSSIAHGIKGLLAGLDGGIYLVDSGFGKNDDQRVREGWEVIKVTVERIRRMALDILYHTKERELSPEPVDAVAFAADVAMPVARKVENSRIALVEDFDASVGTISVDAPRLQSALLNILENAVDACRKASRGSHTIRFGMRADKDDVVFTVSDDGVGMDAETKEKIFDLFYSSKVDKGTGLGLFIANKIVGQHGGAIAVDTVKGKGARFTVRVPKKPLASAGGP